MYETSSFKEKREGEIFLIVCETKNLKIQLIKNYRLHDLFDA